MGIGVDGEVGVEVGGIGVSVAVEVDISVSVGMTVGTLEQEARMDAAKITGSVFVFMVLPMLCKKQPNGLCYLRLAGVDSA
jgi:hypothetical protein